MDLPNWPPDSGGAFDPRNPKFAISAEAVVIKGVSKVDGHKITFTCDYEGRPHTYDFVAPDEKTAGKLAAILRDNVGNFLFSVGSIEIPRNPE
jgi:hypothetical protein